jgi:hypothetical protein
VCFRRNVHGRQLGELRAAAEAWEPAPPAFPLLDVAGLLRGEARPFVTGPPCRPELMTLACPRSCCWTWRGSCAARCALLQRGSPAALEPSPACPGICCALQQRVCGTACSPRSHSSRPAAPALSPCTSEQVLCLDSACAMQSCSPRGYGALIVTLYLWRRWPQGITEVEMDEGAADAPADAPPAQDAPPQPTSRSRARYPGLYGDCGCGVVESEGLW